MDMESISEIKDEEIKDEVNNLVSAFASINNKFNNIINQEKLENQLSGFRN